MRFPTAFATLRQHHQRLWRGAMLSLCLLALLNLHPSKQYTLDEVLERGQLRVIGVAGPTTFLPHGDAGVRGLQYELLRQLADELNMSLVIEQAPNADAVISALKAGEADIGITGLVNDDPRLAKLLLSHPYLETRLQLIKHRQHTVSDEAKIAVSANSAEAQTVLHQQYGSVVEIRHATPDTLLSELNAGEVDYTVLTDSEFAARRMSFPDLTIKTELNNAQLSWAIRPRDKTLQRVANRFLDTATKDGTLKRLTAFYSQGNTFNSFGVMTFQKDIQQRLPLYQTQFKKQADKHDMDWRLLAAIAYQESKWDVAAVSPTGVTGIMMLTKSTAKEMGIANRNNPQQSILAGSAYYQRMIDKIPATVHEPDRTWMALAAYNMGYRHVLKARELTARYGDDPDKWLDVSRHLRQLPRSGQALVYVQEVRRYYDALLLEGNRHHWMASLDKKWVVAE
ncbi:membrane-bound lytic murein transglycosylase MltF [Agitococcus lubricus]|nr:membrane-bound lytic murein transglycosylase MltF [Agitococcus lubricus]